MLSGTIIPVMLGLLHLLERLIRVLQAEPKIKIEVRHLCLRMAEVHGGILAVLRY